MVIGLLDKINDAVLLLEDLREETIALYEKMNKQHVFVLSDEADEMVDMHNS